LVKLSPKKIIVNHIEALNHCGVTRDILRQKLDEENLIDKVYIPNDGESIVIN
jgi:hypothetical protein